MTDEHNPTEEGAQALAVVIVALAAVAPLDRERVLAAAAAYFEVDDVLAAAKHARRT